MGNLTLPLDTLTITPLHDVEIVDVIDEFDEKVTFLRKLLIRVSLKMMKSFHYED